MIDLRVALPRLVLIGLGWLIAVPAWAGYTHYFTWHDPPDPAALARCIERMAEVIGVAEDLVAGADGTGSPEIGPSQLVFNGRSPLEHEPLVFPGQIGFNFCKTSYKPYDAVVTAVLITARDCFPPEVLEIASDGTWSDWAEGVELYRQAFATGPVNSLPRELADVGFVDMTLGFGLFSMTLWWLLLLLLLVFCGWFLRRQSRLTDESHRAQLGHIARSQAHMKRVEEQLERLISAVEQSHTKE